MPNTQNARNGANYRGKFQRLVKLKNKYDPTSWFRLNANIGPTTMAGVAAFEISDVPISRRSRIAVPIRPD